MESQGFSRERHPLGYSPSFRRVVNGLLHYVVRDNVMGGNFRIFLGHRCIPAMPPRDTTDPQAIEAESPWFRYIEGYRTREEALQECVIFMEKVGIHWLTNPLQRPNDHWMTVEKMLIFVHGLQLPVPRPVRVLP